MLFTNKNGYLEKAIFPSCTISKLSTNVFEMKLGRIDTVQIMKMFCNRTNILVRFLSN